MKAFFTTFFDKLIAVLSSRWFPTFILCFFAAGVFAWHGKGIESAYESGLRNGRDKGEMECERRLPPGTPIGLICALCKKPILSDQGSSRIRIDGKDGSIERSYHRGCFDAAGGWDRVLPR